MDAQKILELKEGLEKNKEFQLLGEKITPNMITFT